MIVEWRNYAGVEAVAVSECDQEHVPRVGYPDEQ